MNQAVRCLTFLLSVFFSLLNAQGWLPVDNSPTVRNLYAVYATDGLRAYTVGAGGTILKTSNGGSNWMIRNSGTGRDFNSVCFTDFLLGIAVGGPDNFENQ
jgi:photosystem II stability/assembly factor-like uncharacterized protein